MYSPLGRHGNAHHLNARDIKVGSLAVAGDARLGGELLDGNGYPLGGQNGGFYECAYPTTENTGSAFPPTLNNFPYILIHGNGDKIIRGDSIQTTAPHKFVDTVVVKKVHAPFKDPAYTGGADKNPKWIVYLDHSGDATGDFFSAAVAPGQYVRIFPQAIKDSIADLSCNTIVVGSFTPANSESPPELGVNGNVEMGGDVAVNGSLTVTDVVASGAVAVDSLTVTNAVVANGTVNINGVTRIGTFTPFDVASPPDVGVKGDVEFEGAVAVSGSLTVNGNVIRRRATGAVESNGASVLNTQMTEQGLTISRLEVDGTLQSDTLTLEGLNYLNAIMTAELNDASIISPPHFGPLPPIAAPDVAVAAAAASTDVVDPYQTMIYDWLTVALKRICQLEHYITTNLSATAAFTPYDPAPVWTGVVNYMLPDGVSTHSHMPPTTFGPLVGIVLGSAWDTDVAHNGAPLTHWWHSNLQNGMDPILSVGDRLYAWDPTTQQIVDDQRWTNGTQVTKTDFGNWPDPAYPNYYKNVFSRLHSSVRNINNGNAHIFEVDPPPHYTQYTYYNPGAAHDGGIRRLLTLRSFRTEYDDNGVPIINQLMTDCLPTSTAP